MCFYYITATHMNLFFFFFNDTATTEIYTLSLHDALPISCQLMKSVCPRCRSSENFFNSTSLKWLRLQRLWSKDRKSTRLNSSHSQISYAVFCLKKKKRYRRLVDAYILHARRTAQ